MEGRRTFYYHLKSHQGHCRTARTRRAARPLTVQPPSHVQPHILEPRGHAQLTLYPTWPPGHVPPLFRPYIVVVTLALLVATRVSITPKVSGRRGASRSGRLLSGTTGRPDHITSFPASVCPDAAGRDIGHPRPGRIGADRPRHALPGTGLSWRHQSRLRCSWHRPSRPGNFRRCPFRSRPRPCQCPSRP